MRRHPWDHTIAEHRETSDALGRAVDAAIDVGKQRESIHQTSPPELQDDRRLCFICQDRRHDDGSDFCTPCRGDLGGGR